MEALPLPLFYPALETVFDYLPAGAVIALDHLAREAREEPDWPC